MKTLEMVNNTQCIWKSQSLVFVERDLEEVCFVEGLRLPRFPGGIKQDHQMDFSSEALTEGASIFSIN